MQYYVEMQQYFTDKNFFIGSAGKFKAWLTFSLRMKNHVKVVCEHDILHFGDNVHLLKYYPVNVLQKLL